MKALLVFCLVFSQTTAIVAQNQQIFSSSQIVTEGRVWDVAFEDFNLDNTPDLVIANWFMPPAIYFNNGSGIFNNIKTLPCQESEPGFYQGHAVGINDFNNDQNPDIFFVFNGRNTLLYLSDEKGELQNDSLNTNNSDGLYISMADADNDNDIDAFVTNYKQPTVLWKNDGNGKFEKMDFDFGTNGYNTEPGDINNDGFLDVVCSANGKVIVWFNKDGSKYEQGIQSIGNSKGFGRIKLADMNNDGNLDIILANRSAGGSVWLNDGKGVFSEMQGKLTKSSTLAVADIDLNGRMDFVLGNTIWLNDENGQFTRHGDFEIEGSIFGLWLQDIDNDGDLDLFYSTSVREKGLILLKNKTKMD